MAVLQDVVTDLLALSARTPTQPVHVLGLARAATKDEQATEFVVREILKHGD